MRMIDAGLFIQKGGDCVVGDKNSIVVLSRLTVIDPGSFGKLSGLMNSCL